MYTKFISAGKNNKECKEFINEHKLLFPPDPGVAMIFYKKESLERKLFLEDK